MNYIVSLNLVKEPAAELKGARDFFVTVPNALKLHFTP